MILAAILGLMLASDDDYNKSGSALLSECERYEKYGGGETTNDSGAAACFAYIRGVSETALHYEYLLEMVAKGERRIAAARKESAHPALSSSVCAPDGVTIGQTVRVVVKYLHDHPERLHESRLALTLDSLKAAFPCPK
jgi:hypothetical protein